MIGVNGMYDHLFTSHPGSAQMEVRPQSPTVISTAVVVNMIWWMIMIAAIGVGAMHLGSCPVQPNIPIYLIVLGVSSLVSLSLTYVRIYTREGVALILVSVCVTLVHLFTFCWFIAGTIWVYSVHFQNNSPGTDHFCHKTTYQFAFVITTVVWVLLSLVFLCGGCFLLLACCKFVTPVLSEHSTSYGGTSSLAGGV
ncbi:transmembrane protein 272-like isoform X2 [Genypterus blacodes]|uniref:transmembrane protein 272-like isoform X2 n=1 Tax=Genypterus blacodes TaxID=154954 RepID=UPI003F762B10